MHAIGNGFFLATNRRWADSNMGNVDTCPQEGEGAEGDNHHQVWLSLFAQFSANH